MPNVLSLPVEIPVKTFQEYLHQVKHNLNEYLVKNDSIHERKNKDEKKAQKKDRPTDEKNIEYSLADGTNNYLACERLIPEFWSRIVGGKARHLDETHLPARGTSLSYCFSLEGFNEATQVLTYHFNMAEANLPVVSDEKTFNEAIALMTMLAVFARLQDVKPRLSFDNNARAPLDVKVAANALLLKVRQNIQEYAAKQGYDIDAKMNEACPIEQQFNALGNNRV